MTKIKIRKFSKGAFGPPGLFNEDEMTKIKIGKRLRAWRVEQGWQGYKLAQVINISQGSLSDIENGKSYPSAPTIIKIMAKTDIDIHWLLLGEQK